MELLSDCDGLVFDLGKFSGVSFLLKTGKTGIIPPFIFLKDEKWSMVWGGQLDFFSPKPKWFEEHFQDHLFVSLDENMVKFVTKLESLSDMERSKPSDVSDL